MRHRRQSKAFKRDDSERAASELMAPFHDRMPVILRPRDYDRWIEREAPGKSGGGERNKYEPAMLAAP